jgi:hypothetical protein
VDHPFAELKALAKRANTTDAEKAPSMIAYTSVEVVEYPKEVPPITHAILCPRLLIPHKLRHRRAPCSESRMD